MSTLLVTGLLETASLSRDFERFLQNLTITSTTRSTISARYKAITKRLNIDFWSSSSDTAHSLYVGSYGRDTAIKSFSDLDMIMVLPNSIYHRYNQYQGNGQSALLQAVRNSILKTYSSTAIGGDGQVVVVTFSDGICFEVVPAFRNNDGVSFTYPDANNGGRWRATNPKPEIDAITCSDAVYNGNLRRLARMMRAWKDTWQVPMGGLLIDTLAYSFLDNYKYADKGTVYYDWFSRDFFKYMADQNQDQNYWYAPGSNQFVWRKGLFEYKALRCYNISLEAIQAQNNGYEYTARSKWREIYGTAFPV